MKKSRILALALVLALMMIGTAYAAWTQTIEVATTVETGELHIDVSNGHNQTGIKGDLTGVDTSGLVTLTSTYDNTDPNTEDITFTGINFFPGTTYQAHIKLKNDGTIPADINIITGAVNMPAPTDDITYNISIRHSIDKNLYGNGTYVVASASGTDLAAIMEQLRDDVAANGLTLLVGEYAHMRLNFEFKADADETSLPEDSLFDFGFKFDVSQFNID